MVENGWKRFQNAINTITGIFLFLVMILIFIQVIIRFIFVYSIPWTEELSRFLFVYVIFLSLNITIRDNIPIKIDFLDSALKGKAQHVVRIIVDIISLLILAVSAYSGYKFLGFGFISSSPGLGIPLYIIYFSMPLGYLLSVIETIRQIAIKIKGGYE